MGVAGILIGLLMLAAQQANLGFRLTRDWGYGGMDNSIQGRFSMHASGPDNLVEVRFMMDGEVVNVDSEAPFRYQFETNEFAPGEHTMNAVGTLSDGSELYSAFVVRNFLSTEDANQQVQDFILPLLLVIAAITLFGVGGPLLLGRKRKHTPGVYGPAGGAVCRKCALPFSRSMLAPNMLVGKLERCPHCGKWAIVPRASAAALAEAEARFAGTDSMEGDPFESDEDKRSRLLDESRFSE